MRRCFFFREGPHRYLRGLESDRKGISLHVEEETEAGGAAYVCRMETRQEILSVLALCTDTQRERFLLHALYDFSYAEVAELCGCSKQAVQLSIEAVRKKFLRFFKNHLDD